MHRQLQIIAGKDSGQSISIADGQSLIVGRSSASDFRINDPLVSRKHFTITANGKQTWLTDENSRGGVAVNGERVEKHYLKNGDVIRIGETKIRFQQQSLDDETDDGESTFAERVFKHSELKSFSFADAVHQMEILSTLPQRIAESRNDADLAARLVDLLLDAIPEAHAAAVAAFDVAQVGEPGQSLELSQPKMMRWNSRSDIRFKPSRRLIARVLRRTESVLHMWTDAEDQYTMSGELDWAFCTPIEGEMCAGWCIYVSGKLDVNKGSPLDSKRLQGHVKFTELVSQFIAAIRRVRILQNQHSLMSQFFTPKVIETVLSAETDHVLQPREGPITVMFCDIRGFSKQVEANQDQLHIFLDRVSEGLGVMTRAVMEHHGVIADFQGDAVMAFWGWPAASDDSPLAACRAALLIAKQFQEANQNKSHLLHGLHVGIGIAHGRAIAGKIGTAAQAKVGVFGPVVNLAARLEGMTKQFCVPIIVDQVVAQAAREKFSNDDARVRTLATVRPKGMDNSVEISELVQPATIDSSQSSDSITAHESAVILFAEGNWKEARTMMSNLPDGKAAFGPLLRFIERFEGAPPENWDGVVPLDDK